MHFRIDCMHANSLKKDSLPETFCNHLFTHMSNPMSFFLSSVEHKRKYFFEKFMLVWNKIRVKNEKKKTFDTF